MLHAFHLALATLLELFHPCYLSNVKQGNWYSQALRTPSGTHL